MIRKIMFAVLSGLVIASMLAACAPQATPTVSATEPATAVAVTEAPVVTTVPVKQITVAVVAGGEVGDAGFIDSANEGLTRMEAEFGVKTIMIQTRMDASIYLDSIISAAEQADLIFIVPGYFFDEQLKQVVPEFPDKTFVYVDGATSIEGMASAVFLQNEGAFLAGALAALMTTDTNDLIHADAAKHIGFMGGADWPVIHDYQVGFDQGAKYAVSDIDVLDQYAGTHFDPAVGKETALAMYAQGVDIIFQAAGPTGLGVFQAATEAEKYVIGVDSNQKSLAPDYTIASMRKNVGDSIFQVVQMYMNGQIKPGDVYSFGLAENGVGIDYGGMAPDLVPQEIKDKIAEYRDLIIDGTIVVDIYTAP